MPVRTLIVLALAAAANPVLAAGNVIYAGASWSAIDRGGSCEAMTRALRIAAKGKVQAIAGVAFTADRSRWGEFRARLSRVPRPGSTVMLSVAGQPFLLATRGNFAWSSSPLQQQSIISAMRQGGGMRIEARDGAGRRFSDQYLLDSAPTAIDAAAARCALRHAGKIR